MSGAVLSTHFVLSTTLCPQVSSFPFTDERTGAHETPSTHITYFPVLSQLSSWSTWSLDGLFSESVL